MTTALTRQELASGTADLPALGSGPWRIDGVKAWYDLATFRTNGPTTVAPALAGLAVGAPAVCCCAVRRPRSLRRSRPRWSSVWRSPAVSRRRAQRLMPRR
ncbi:hypothetical protein AV521_10475 [Streptomyces sp. IMTB 2501]|uniref:hypothetical protein n=1 Tax=Streptomyces sp. IMTB 2501 TaxID=1776340 RepID=UPI00096FBCA7|nr:hypothetical protein [Streptomyces sp. IMTB 2501]OLZ71379.1 hypothetical protein AV521_10475 [Streptomyces sp. IMTB 2501]